MTDAKTYRGEDFATPIEAEQDLSPFQITLGAMIFPLWAHGLFNLVGGAALALVGAPRIAAIWTVALCAVDAVLQMIFRRWTLTAAETDSARGLVRLSLLSLVKNCLWFAGPLAFVVLSHSGPGLALLAVTAITMSTLGVSLGWTSDRMYVAMVVPPVIAMMIGAFAALGWSAAAAGVGVAVGMMAMMLVVIAAGTHKSVSGWSRANNRTIAAMKEMRAALVRSEAAERRLRMAIEIANLHVFEVDYVNKTLVSLGAEQDFFETPLTYERVVGNSFGDVSDEFRPHAEAVWQDYLAGKGPYRLEYRVKREDGAEVWAFVAAELIRNEAGRPLSMVGALHNITERKRGELELTAALDRAEAGSRAKSDFLATMSHEIRTPLNGVLGMAQAMAGDELSTVQRDRLEVIRRSGVSLLTLLNSVLDLSKIEAGMLELEDGELDLAAIAGAALDAFSGEAAAKGLTLTLDVAAEARGLYRGDGARLGQVLTNLVSNAVKFTPAGAVTLTIARDGAVTVLEVADTGVGISPEFREALFEKFVQADSSVTRRFGGTGLGLAICRDLVAMMGGTISAAERGGGGTVFSMRLPLPKLDAAPAADSARAVQPPSEPAAERADLRVLAAEDNDINQLVLRTLLEQVGITPVIVGDGEEALAAWRAMEWDLILMDVQMPVLDGVSATAVIRREEMQTGRRRTPIVALTANVMDHQISGYRSIGIDDVVGKPLQIGRLLEVIGAILDADTPSAPRDQLSA